MTRTPAQQISIDYREGAPLEVLAQWLERDGGPDGLLVVRFPLLQYWLPDSPAISLSAAYLQWEGRLTVAVTDQRLRDSGLAPAEQYAAWLAEHALASLEPGRVLQMQPLSIPKPWGQEIWYTGIEQRGISRFGDETAGVPIPWLLPFLPGQGELQMPLLGRWSVKGAWGHARQRMGTGKTLVLSHREQVRQVEGSATGLEIYAFLTARSLPK